MIGLENLGGTNAEAGFAEIGHEAAVAIVELHVGGGRHREAVLGAPFWKRLGIRGNSALFFVFGLGFVYFGLVQGARECGGKGIQIL